MGIRSSGSSLTASDNQAWAALEGKTMQDKATEVNISLTVRCASTFVNRCAFGNARIGLGLAGFRGGPSL